MKTIMIMIRLVTMADNELGYFLRGLERLALIRSQARIRAAKCYNQRADSRPFAPQPRVFHLEPVAFSVGTIGGGMGAR